jgi:hypothetical protein
VKEVLTPGNAHSRLLTMQRTAPDVISSANTLQANTHREGHMHSHVDQGTLHVATVEAAPDCSQVLLDVTLLSHNLPQACSGNVMCHKVPSLYILSTSSC